LAVAEGLKKLLVQVVAVSQHHKSGVVHFLRQYQLANVKHHREALTAALGVPDHACAAVTSGLFFNVGQAINRGVLGYKMRSLLGGGAQGGPNGFIDRKILVIGGNLFEGSFFSILEHDKVPDHIQKRAFI